MTTTDRTKMPTDEVMGRVVAEWKGWFPESCVRSALDDDMWDGLPKILNASHESCTDPRSDPDAALELLGYIRTGYAGGTQLAEDGRNWLVYLSTGTVAIPISGEGFRRGVCWLACDVLGVE